MEELDHCLDAFLCIVFCSDMREQSHGHILVSRSINNIISYFCRLQ
jgi:hypothetical protein